MIRKKKQDTNQKVPDVIRPVKGWIGIVVIIIVAMVLIGFGTGWTLLNKEHREAQNVNYEDLDFSTLKDGTYTGTYEGGMYKWRENTVQVTIRSGKVTKIQALNSVESNNDLSLLYQRVLKEQTLKVDGISGATLTTKAYLKGLEIALKKAK